MTTTHLCRLCREPLRWPGADGDTCEACVAALAQLAELRGDPPPLVSLGQGDYAHEPDGTFAVALCVFGIVVAVGLAVWVLLRWWT